MGSSYSSSSNRAGKKTPSEGAHCLGMASTKSGNNSKGGADKLSTKMGSKGSSHSGAY